jgi:hypothetical protein
LRNLTAIGFTIPFVSDQRIGSEINMSLGSPGDYDQSAVQIGSGQTCDPSKAKYVSIEHEGTAIMYDLGFESTHGYDIDVSCDGEIWFHAIGAKCIKGRRLVRLPKVRRVPRRDR